MSLFHTPIIEAIDNFVRNPSDTKQLYDDVEAFCLRNIKAFGSDHNSASKTIGTYAAIIEHIDSVNAKSFTKTISDKIQIPRFIQAVLFKESIRTASKLQACSIKQFQEILFYYECRIGGVDYKSYQGEFQSLFGKIYLAMSEEDRVHVEKLINSDDLTYRLKKLMKSAVQEVHASIVGRGNVADSLVKGLQSDQTKPTAPELSKNIVTKSTQKTTAKKSQGKTTKEEGGTQPTTMSEDRLKEAQGQVSALLSGTKDLELNVELDGVSYQPYQLSQVVQASVDFTSVFTDLVKQDPSEEDKILNKMILQSNDPLIRKIIIDSIITKFYTQVVEPTKEHLNSVDPLRVEFEELQGMVSEMTEGMDRMVNMMSAFSERLKKAKK